MRKLKEKLSTSSSVSASILSLALTLMGFSSFELIVWWHFVIAFLCVLVVYAVFFILIETIIRFYKKYIERASIKSNVNEEIKELENYVDAIYTKDAKFEQTTIECYKDILVKEIFDIYDLAIKKINFIELYIKNQAIKKESKSLDKTVCSKYKEFCDYIRNKYNFQ